MENKNQYVMKPGTREPRKKWGEDKGKSRYDRIRQLRFFPFFSCSLIYFLTISMLLMALFGNRKNLKSLILFRYGTAEKWI